EKDDHRRHDVRTARSDELRGVVVDQRAVLDRAYAEFGAALNRARRMAVGGHVGPPLGAFVDDRADLVLAILVHPDRIGWRRHTAGAIDLDAVRPLPQLVARCVDARVDAVGHAATPVNDTA